METTQTLRRKIESAGELQSVVRTMKMLAAVNIRECDRAVAALEEHTRVIEMGFQVILRNHRMGTAESNSAHERLGVVVFGSDEGLCGQLNEQVANYTLRCIRPWARDGAEPSILAIGSRVAAHLMEAGVALAEKPIAMPQSLVSIAPASNELLLKLESWTSAGDVDRVVLFYAKRLSGTSYSPRYLRVLPLDPEWLRSLASRRWPSRRLPVLALDPRQILSSLVRHYLLVSSHRAFAESMASENASRLASMEGAERNVEDLLEQLGRLYRETRQSAITAELMDIVTGYEALREEQHLCDTPVSGASQRKLDMLLR